MLTLEVQERQSGEDADALRDNGLVPAVVYGPKEPTTSVAVDARTLERVWKEAGETTIVTIKGAGADKDTLIHEIQTHPITGKIMHADFYALEKGKKVELAVPLEFVGQAPAEKAGFILVKALHEIEIEVAPAELPHQLDVDVSKLETAGDRITASDIPLPPSATLITNGDEIIVSVTEQETESTEPAAVAAPAESPATAQEGTQEATE